MKFALLITAVIAFVAGAILPWPRKGDLRFQIISDVVTEKKEHRVKMGATTYLLPPEIVGATVECTKIAGGKIEIVSALTLEETPETEIKFATVFWSEDLENQSFAFVYHNNSVSSEWLHAAYLEEGQLIVGTGRSAQLELEGYPLRLDTFVVHRGQLPTRGWPKKNLTYISPDDLAKITEGDPELIFYTLTVKRGNANAP